MTTTKQEVVTREKNAPLTPPEMLRLALEKNAGVETLERLMAMKERWEAGEAKKAFVASLNAFKANPPKLEKNRSIMHKENLISKYAGLDQVSDVVGAALHKVGIAHRWEIEQTEGVIKVTCVLTHEQGHSERVTVQGPADDSGAKNKVQAIGSTITYLQRYSLLAATGLATTNQDDDGKAGGAGEPITEKQKDELIALIKETGADTAKFIKYLKVESLDDLPASRFGSAKSALEAKRGRA